MLNTGVLNGRLTADVKRFENGGGRISLAVRSNRKDKGGNYPTEFYTIILNKNLAEHVEKYVKKGDGVNVLYSLSIRKNKDTNRDEIILIGENVYFDTAGRKSGSSNGTSNGTSNESKSAAKPKAPEQSSSEDDVFEEIVGDDDELPF